MSELRKQPDRLAAWARGLGLGGAAGFATAANVFVGMVGAPLFVRAWLGTLGRADLFIMVAGLATISGNTLAVYALFLRDVLPERRGEIAALGPAALLGGTLACCMTGAAVGALLPG